MCLYTVFTQMYMTNVTVHGVIGSLTQGAAYNILGAVPGVHAKQENTRAHGADSKVHSVAWSCDGRRLA
uniref:Uncharacterized protein n=1 Tax=Magallana gigas TaxID=29159 RepID=K1QMU7_MAGGI